MNIKKILVGAAASALLFGSIITPAFASSERLNFGTQINAATCDKTGLPVVNVTQKVVNDVDSGTGGNYWAYDNLNRSIQVWKTSTTDTYCAVVKYQGQFTTVAGMSPGVATDPGGTVGDGVKGTFEGGYNATITGTLLASPLWETKGSIGTTDYQCDILGNCPGYVDWITQYFPSDTSVLNWWGWVYHGGNNGTWVNSSDGNSGDITGN